MNYAFRTFGSGRQFDYYTLTNNHKPVIERTKPVDRFSRVITEKKMD